MTPHVLDFLIVVLSTPIISLFTYAYLCSISEKKLRQIYNTYDSVILKNASIQDTIIHTKILFDRSNKDTLIVCGKLNSNIYGNQGLRTSIKNYLQKGRKLHIFVGPEYNKEQADFFKKLKQTGCNVQIFVLKETPKKHFMVSGDYFRDEVPHNLNAGNRKALVGKNKKSSERIRELSRIFTQRNINNVLKTI